MKLVTFVKVGQTESYFEAVIRSGEEVNLEQLLIEELNQGLVNDICNAV